MTQKRRSSLIASSSLATRLKWSSPLAVFLAGERATVQRTFDILEPALEGSFVLPAGDSTFVFAHDRIQQACAALPSDESPATSHHRSARVLLNEWICNGGLTVMALESNSSNNDNNCFSTVDVIRRGSRFASRSNSEISIINNTNSGSIGHAGSSSSSRGGSLGHATDVINVDSGGTFVEADVAHSLRRYSMPDLTCEEPIGERVGRDLRRLSMHDDDKRGGRHEELLVSLYNVASHFEAAVECLQSMSERAQVARIFWIVGRRALRTSAFEVALRYFQIAVTLADIPRDTRCNAEDEARLTLPFWPLWTAVARCLLVTKPDEAELLLTRLAHWARSESERCSVCFMRVANYILQSQVHTVSLLLFVWLLIFVLFCF